ncbi:DUF2127 domain-containing protein [uncultured Psychrobacter sp.]|uniref:DUF2127 domain-containing protein n=1 Tax=uncultured Psychrobacter sp. TaxID=259303 RepID=UPI00345AB6F0
MTNRPVQEDKVLSLPPKRSHKFDKQDQALSSYASKSSESIKAVAIYEIVKGGGALLMAAALWLWHKDLEQWLATVTQTWHQQFGQLLAPQVDSIVQLAQRASKNWTLFLLLIFAYASLRFIEAYGLWQDKTWAYWFSVIGYGIFIPVELYYLITGPFDWFKLGIFVLNIIIVVVVYRNMKHKGLL